jgi:hypothetical protein
VAVIAAIVGFLFWRKRKQQTQYKPGTGGNEGLFIVRPPTSQPPTSQPPTSDPEKQKILYSGDYTTSKSAAAMGGGTSTTNIVSAVPKTPKSPQGVVQLNADLEWSMLDLENQQKQLDLKRQLLVLQQQEQELHSSPLMMNMVSQQPSPSLYQKAPQSGAFGSQGEGYGQPHEYSPQASVYQAYPTPPPVIDFVGSPAPKQTVHTMPEAYIEPPKTRSQAVAAMPTGEMFQDSTEPNYAPVPPEAVPRWLPGLEYQEGTMHNGVGWVRATHAPHAVVGSAGQVQQ